MAATFLLLLLSQTLTSHFYSRRRVINSELRVFRRCSTKPGTESKHRWSLQDWTRLQSSAPQSCDKTEGVQCLGTRRPLSRPCFINPFKTFYLQTADEHLMLFKLKASGINTCFCGGFSTTAAGATQTIHIYMYDDVAHWSFQLQTIKSHVFMLLTFCSSCWTEPCEHLEQLFIHLGIIFVLLSTIILNYNY